VLNSFQANIELDKAFGETKIAPEVFNGEKKDAGMLIY
jgi:hypothetical protein